MLSEHLPGEPNSFYVIPFDEPRNQIKLTARNRDQKRIWTQHIKGVMLEELDIPTRAKELVYQLGNEEGESALPLFIPLALPLSVCALGVVVVVFVLSLFVCCIAVSVCLLCLVR